MARATLAQIFSLIMAVPAVSLQLLDPDADAEPEHAVTTRYGKDSCPCVGIEGLDGTVYPDFGAAGKTAYPAEIGSYCDAWDSGRYPDYCPFDNGTDASWCASQWCYVDPCDCNDIDSNPSKSSYFPNATYEGKAIFYSYATCGDTNTFNTPPSEEQKAECAKTWDETKYGLEKCPCVGIDGLEGFTKVTIGNETISDVYPADIGSRCVAWDDGRYPDYCPFPNGTKANWCTSAWCYVDKTNCELPAGSKGPYESTYLPGGKFGGKPLYYSYVTCNATNTYDR